MYIYMEKDFKLVRFFLMVTFPMRARSWPGSRGSRPEDGNPKRSCLLLLGSPPPLLIMDVWADHLSLDDIG